VFRGIAWTNFRFERFFERPHFLHYSTSGRLVLLPAAKRWVSIPVWVKTILLSTYQTPTNSGAAFFEYHRQKTWVEIWIHDW